MESAGKQHSRPVSFSLLRFDQMREFQSVNFKHRGSDMKQIFPSTNLAQNLEYACMIFPLKHNSNRDSTAAAARQYYWAFELNFQSRPLYFSSLILQTLK